MVIEKDLFRRRALAALLSLVIATSVAISTAFVVVPIQQQQQRYSHFSSHVNDHNKQHGSSSSAALRYRNQIGLRPFSIVTKVYRTNNDGSSSSSKRFAHQQPNLTNIGDNQVEGCGFISCATVTTTTTTQPSIVNIISTIKIPVVTAMLFLVTCAIVPTNAMAADGLFFTISPTWNSALLAYGHYFFILLGTILLSYERFTVEADMSVEKEKSLVIVDALYGVVGAALATTGYFRVISEYGKGWEYYAHEPLFWVKLSAASLLAGLSLFPTTIFIKRGSKLFQEEEIEPMSEALATRVRKILNAELSAILSVPLIATLMARGVTYNQDFPWQLGAAFTILTLVGSGSFYARQALNWNDPLESNEPSA